MQVRCLSCGATSPTESAVARVKGGEAVPTCLPGCGGLLKPDTISFGQPLANETVTRALQWLADCGLLIIMGTSLRYPFRCACDPPLLIVKPNARAQPVNKYPAISLNKHTPMAVANMEETPYDEYAEVLLNDDRCGNVMAELQELLEGYLYERQATGKLWKLVLVSLTKT